MIRISRLHLPLIWLLCMLFLSAYSNTSPLTIATPLPTLFSQAPLSAEAAFQLHQTLDSQQVILSWKIAPHYYLYQSEFKFHLQNAAGAQLGLIDFPPAIEKQDPYLGKQAIYYHQVQLNIPIIGIVPAGATLSVTYRGCSGSLCYTPQTALITLPTGMGAPVIASTQPIQKLLQNHSPLLALLTLLLAGLLLSLTPCILPMIPILSSIIVGQRTAGKAFQLSCSYVLGMSLTYTVMGMVVARVGLSVQAFLQQPWVLSGGAVLMVLLALSLFGLYRLQLPTRIQAHIIRWYPDHRRSNAATVFLMGVIATLIVSPCTSAPLIGVLGYIAQTGNIGFGGIALFCLAIGMSIPLLVMGAGAGKWLPKTGAWMLQIQYFLGVVMIAMALWLVSRFLSSEMVWILFAILLMGYASSWRIFHLSVWKKPKGLHWLGVMITGYALLLIINALTGHTNPLRPWAFLQKPSLNLTKGDFIPVHTLAELEIQLTQAAQQQQPVVIDFYANWCVECQILQNTVFPDLGIQKALRSYRQLQINVTDTTPDNQQLLKHFNILGIPTLIILNSQGTETQRLSGNISITELQQSLQLNAP